MGHGCAPSFVPPLSLPPLTLAALIQVNVIETFGLVPQSVFPESFNSSNTSKVDGLLTTKLREFALELREITASSMRALNDLEGKSYAEKMQIAVQSARKRKVEQVRAFRPPFERATQIGRAHV